MQVFKEALRLYGPVVATTKQVADGGVMLNGYKIPSGTRLTVIMSCNM